MRTCSYWFRIIAIISPWSTSSSTLTESSSSPPCGVLNMLAEHDSILASWSHFSREYSRSVPSEMLISEKRYFPIWRIGDGMEPSMNICRRGSISRISPIPYFLRRYRNSEDTESSVILRPIRRNTVSNIWGKLWISRTFLIRYSARQKWGWRSLKKHIMSPSSILSE